MDISVLLEKKKRYEAMKGSISKATLTSFENAFEVEYTHHSTAIEGNTLTLMETKVVLEDGIAIGGKSLREIYEVINHNKAYQYLKECIGKGLALDKYASYGELNDFAEMIAILEEKKLDKYLAFSCAPNPNIATL